jgi:DNA-binding beta-propeller fold protein YncE
VVTHGSSKDVCVFDAKSKQFSWMVTLDGVFPKGITVSLDDKYALVSLVEGNEVVTIDLEKRVVLKRLRTGNNPEGLVYFGSIK